MGKVQDALTAGAFLLILRDDGRIIVRNRTSPMPIRSTQEQVVPLSLALEKVGELEREAIQSEIAWGEVSELRKAVRQAFPDKRFDGCMAPAILLEGVAELRSQLATREAQLSAAKQQLSTAIRTRQRKLEDGGHYPPDDEMFVELMDIYEKLDEPDAVLAALSGEGKGEGE